MSKLSAAHLRKRYKARTVVHDVSLDVASGEVVGLLGPNGAGKTTCFYMIVGLVAADGGTHRARRREPVAPADPPPRAPRPVLPAAGSVDLPQAHRRGERARDPRAAGPRRRHAVQPARRAARGPVDLAPRRRAGHLAVRRRAAALSRSRARSPPGRASSCSTSRSPASTRSPCSTSRRSSASSRSAASAC